MKHSDGFNNQAGYFRLITILVFAVGAALSSLATAATKTKTGVLMEEVVTYATKKAKGQALQEAPVAVTAYTPEQLELTQATDLQNLSYRMPNVSLDGVGTTPGVANFSIRGYGIISSIPSIDPSVGVFLDDVYLGTTFGVISDFLDIEGVEVLRGPQGVLFGRNVTGGAVLIRSAKPSEEFQANFRTRYETGNDQTYSGMINGALSGNILGRVAVYYRNDDGWFDNEAYNGEDYGAQETYLIRPSITFKPSDHSRHTLIFEHMESKGDGGVTQGSMFDDHDVGNDFVSKNDMKATRASLESVWDISFGNGAITNILGWRKIEQEGFTDIDSSPQPQFNFVQSLDQHQASEEIRYNGTFGDTEVTSGLFYFTQKMDAVSENRPFGSLAPVGGKMDHVAWGVFTQLDYHMTDSLILTAGLRYGHEKKEVDQAPTDSGFCVSGLTLTGNPYTVGTCNQFFNDEEDWSFVLPKVGFTWEFMENGRLYGAYTQGYRSGGFSLRTSTSVRDTEGNAVAGQPPFDEETQDNFELGIKTVLNDGRTTLNVAAFYTKVEDLQKDISVVRLINGILFTGQITTNTADAKMQGVEIELKQQITDSLILDASLGYLDAKYTDVTPEGQAAGINESLDLTRAPELTGSVNLTQEWEFENSGSLVSILSYQHRDSWFSNDTNGWEIPEVDKLSLFFTYYAPQHWSVALFGKNLTDEEEFGFGSALPSPPFGSAAYTTIWEGRTYGIELKYDF